MSLKSKFFISMCLLFAVFIYVFSAQIPSVRSWAWDTHQFVAQKAIDLMPDDENWFFSTYSGTIVSYSIKPDQWKYSDPTEGNRHWYSVDLNGGGGTLLLAVQDNFNTFVQYLKENDWDHAAQLAGVISHYIGDASMPLHATSNYNPGGNHVSFELAVDYQVDIDNVNVNIPGFVPHELGNIFDSTMQLLKDSYSYSSVLIPYLENDILWNNEIKDITENRLRSSAQLLANIWYTAIIQAGPTPALPPAEVAWWRDNIGWIRQFGTSAKDYASSVAVDSSGSVYVAGFTFGALLGQTSSGGEDAFVRKYDGSGSELWTMQFGTSADDTASSVAVDSSNNIYVAGGTDGTLPGQSSSGGWDAYVRKYDGAGSELWTMQFGTSADDGAYCVAVDSSGSVYVAGFTDGTLLEQESSGGYNVFVRKYDGSGNELWTRQFGTLAYDVVYHVAVDSSGNVYVTGATNLALPGQTQLGGGYDAFIRKYDGAGNELWTRQFGTSNVDFAYSVAVDASGKVYVTGYTEGAFPGQISSGGDDAFVRKYDGSGNELWTKQFGTSGRDYALVAVDVSGNVYVTGATEGAFLGQISSGNYDAFVRKYDGSGNEVWTRQFGTSANDYISSVAVDSSGSVYVAGYTDGALHGQASSGDDDAFIIKFVQIVNRVEVSIAWIILAVLIAIAAASFALYRIRHKARVRRGRRRHRSQVVSLGLGPTSRFQF